MNILQNKKKTHNFIWILLFIISFIFIVLSCQWVQNVQRSETKFYSADKVGKYQCGIYNSILFINKTIQEKYKDISLILKYSKKLSLSKLQIAQLQNKAIECFHVCEAEKLAVQSEEIYLRKNIIKKNIKKEAHEIANEVRQIEVLKNKWLDGHFNRYNDAVRFLTKKQKNKLKSILSQDKSIKDYP